MAHEFVPYKTDVKPTRMNTSKESGGFFIVMNIMLFSVKEQTL
jgi:hypothetical protein